MKTCTKCKIELDETEFSSKNKESNKRHSSCKKCHREISKKHYIENKKQYRDRNSLKKKKKVEYLRELKDSTPCKDCEKNYPHYVMEFDHIEEKMDCVTSLVNKGWKVINEELKKCDIVCANCHNTRTWKRKLQTRLGTQMLAKRLDSESGDFVGSTPIQATGKI